MLTAGTYSKTELARLLGVSEGTIQRRVRTPEKYGWTLEYVPLRNGGTQLRIIVSGEHIRRDAAPPPIIGSAIAADEYDEPEAETEPESDENAEISAEAETCDMSELIDKMGLEEQFRTLLHKKLIGKTGNARNQMRKYYTDIFDASGEIPKSLQCREGRKCSGRKRTIPAAIEQRFVEMVKQSLDVQHPDFVTHKNRKVVGFHDALCDEFPNEKVSLQQLYALVKRENLGRYLRQCEYQEEEKPDKKIYYFKPSDPFKLVFMDGCKFRYFRIKNDKGEWSKLQVIEFLDHGTRALLALSPYFSESNEASVDVFSDFVLSGPFPKQHIKLRPDNALGFKNLMRPVAELNRHYSMPDGFFLEFDLARALKPKDKVHLESSHRALHTFEQRIIRKLSEKYKTERVPGWFFDASNTKVQITVTHIDITLEEFRRSGLIEEYKNRHNSRVHRFSEAGLSTAWSPEQKLNEFMQSGVETIRFAPKLVESFAAYGYRKEHRKITPEGGITYNSKAFRVVGGFYLGHNKSMDVQVSEVGNQLYVFENKPDGIQLGEAIYVGPYEEPKFIEKRSEHRKKVNIVDQITVLLQQAGMVADEQSVAIMISEGLSIEIVKQLLFENKARYDRYAGEKGFIAFNLFGADFLAMKQAEIIPYAAAN